MKTYKPTSPGVRQRSDIEYSKLLSGAKKHKKLTKRLTRRAGRNNRGIITTRHKSGGAKKLYRMVDFKQEKMGVPAKVESIEYDPYRSAFISLIVYRDGERRYILAGKDMKVGDEILSDQKTPLKSGNRMQLKHIPIGQFIYNVELRPNGGGKLARSAGSHLEVLGTANCFTDLKMPSKEIRKVAENCFATIGQVSNLDHNLVVYGKAGRSRHRGIRPTVRGSAMNPVDHKYGGGEGKQPRGTKRPKDVYGNITGGRKTRNKKKWSKKHIIKRRPTKR